jgi:hypothetical protein
MKTLKNNHPLMIKLETIYNLMEELNVSLEYAGNGALKIVDNKTSEGYHLLDKGTNEPLPYFPTN